MKWLNFVGSTVLSLTHAAGGCERNWSTHGLIFSDRRKSQQAATLERNVRMFKNMRLRDRVLARGVKDRRSPFHTPGLATVSPEGLPEIRTVVLRGCNPQTRKLRFHTDTRSGKIADMQKQPQAALHFYDPGAKIQLRVRARLELLTGEAYASAWDNTRPMSRECYQVTQAPGSPLSTPGDVVFDAAATNDGADHFAPVVAHVRQIEWLYLAARGHRRALFDFTA